MRNPIVILNDLAMEPKTSVKKKILIANRDNITLRKILDYAVDPHKKFHISQVPLDVRGIGETTIGPATWHVLDRLISREVTGNAAKLELFEHVKTLTHNDSVILRRIVRKKLQIGVSAKTVHSVWPDLVPPRGLQKGEDWDPEYFIPGSYASLKLDGFRGELREQEFYTYGGHKMTGLEHLIKEVASYNPYAHVDGEIIIPGMGFDEMSGLLRSKHGDKSGAKFAIFDNLQIPTISLSGRLDVLKTQYDNYFSNGVTAGFLPHMVVETVDEVELMFRQVSDVGHEGLMIKCADKPYFDGRNHWWMKRKIGFSGEYQILGVYEGKDSFKGTLGGVIIMINGTKVGVGSGFTKRERAQYWINPSSIIGKLGTFNAMEKTKSGSLRHPSFKNIRWDM